MPQNAVIIERAKVRVPWPVRYFLTGQYILSRGDNADFLHDATEDYRGRPVVKLTRARWRRVLRRNLALTVPVILTALSTTPWMNLWMVAAYLILLAGAGLAWCAWRAVTGVRGLRRNRQYVDPAAATLFAELGVRYVRRRARGHVQIPRVWQPSDAEPVRVVLPVARTLTDAQRRKLVRAVGGRLGILDARGSWFEAGPAITVDIAGTPMPPTEITLADLHEAVLTAPATRPIVGVGPDGPLAVDYEQDSPHVACSGPSGTGKSTLFRFLAAQRMRHGNGAIFLDYKRWSHRWAHDLPAERAQYWYRPQDIHDALVAIGEELERRINGTAEELGSYRTVDIYVEEINSLIKILTTYWRGARKAMIDEARAAREDGADYDSADLDPPSLSPAVAALQYAVFMGREMQMHVHVMAQKLEANVFGSNSGGAVRDSFQIRFMAKWDRKLWKMLCDGLDYVAWPGGRRGLWGVAIDGQFQIFRAPNVSDAEAVQLATCGPAVQGSVFGGQIDRSSVHVDGPAINAGQPLATLLGQLPGQDGPARLSLDGLRTAVKRSGHPGLVGQSGRTYLYDLETLAKWRDEMLARDRG